MASELTNKLWRPFLSLSLSPSLSSACSFISAFHHDRLDVIWEAPHVPRVNVNCGLLASSVPTSQRRRRRQLRPSLPSPRWREKLAPLSQAKKPSSSASVRLTRSLRVLMVWGWSVVNCPLPPPFLSSFPGGIFPYEILISRS